MTFQQMNSSQKTDLIILAVTLFIILPLSFVHGLFVVVSFLSFAYLIGAGLLYGLDSLISRNDHWSKQS
ncbi:MAG: hypothetical protein ABEK50_10905 [bacterium]